ncbi:hypothetical protein [Streptomyces sp. NPDC055134]
MLTEISHSGTAAAELAPIVMMLVQLGADGARGPGRADFFARAMAAFDALSRSPDFDEWMARDLAKLCRRRLHVHPGSAPVSGPSALRAVLGLERA